MKRQPQIKITVTKHDSTDYWSMHVDDKLAVQWEEDAPCLLGAKLVDESKSDAAMRWHRKTTVDDVGRQWTCCNLEL